MHHASRVAPEKSLLTGTTVGTSVPGSRHLRSEVSSGPIGGPPLLSGPCMVGIKLAALAWNRAGPSGVRQGEQAAMDRLDRHFGLEAQMLSHRAERMTVLASNIANAATPNYRARDIDFSALLARRPDAPLATTSARHIPAAGAENGPALRYRLPVNPSLDGNTVELATEQVQFAENALRYRMSLSVVSGRIDAVRSALRVE
jgi:flagellar basal-body rod protein FlgB